MRDAPMTARRRRRQVRLMRIVNVPMRWLLSLPFETPLSRRLMLLSFTGHKTGRAYRQPVSYVVHGDVLLTPGGGRWKLNLREGEPIGVRLRGHHTLATPQLVRDPAEVEGLLRTMMAPQPAPCLVRTVHAIRRRDRSRPAARRCRARVLRRPLASRLRTSVEASVHNAPLRIRSIARTRRSGPDRIQSEASTHISWNGAVTCHVVAMPGGSEKRSPAPRSSVPPPAISIRTDPSRIKATSRRSGVHGTGPSTLVKRVSPACRPSACTSSCISLPGTSGRAPSRRSRPSRRTHQGAAPSFALLPVLTSVELGEIIERASLVTAGSRLDHVGWTSPGTVDDPA